MTNIKSGSSDIKFNYNVKNNNSALSGIRANVSNETVTNTKKVETESFYLGTSNDVENKIASEETEITIQTPEQLKKDIASVEQIIDEMQKEVDKIPTYSEYSYHDLVAAGLVNARDEANAKRDELNTYIAQLEYLKKEYQKELNFLKYNDIKETQKYEEFVNNYQINYQNIDFQLFSECGYDINEYLMKKYGEDYKNHDIDPLAIAEAYVDANKDNPNFDINKYATEFDGLIIKVGDEEISAFDFYNYSTKEQQDMYHYLVSTEGTDSANNYLKLIMDDINKNKGYAMAAEYTNTLYLDDENLATNVIDFLSVDAKGLEDGVETFFEGIEQAFKNDGTMSAEDYEKMFVLQYLKENTTLLDDCYEFNNSLGNMVPSMIASAAVSIVATPAAGSVAASALMGLSAAGNAKHDALIDGANPLEANLYAIANGSSEALLGYFLGKIPGISKESEMSLRALFDEGLEEFSQEWVDAMLRSIFLGEDIDLTQVSEDSAKSFLSGILMAGLLNGGQQMIKMTIDGKTVEINAQKLQEYIDEHPEMAIEDILRQSDNITNTDSSILNYNETDFSNMYDNDINYLRQYLRDAGLYDYQIDMILKNKKNAIATAMQIENSIHNKVSMNRYILQNKLKSSKYQRVVDGITFVSDSQAQLNELIDYYEKAKSQAASNTFFKKLEKNHGKELIITNMDNYTSYCYMQDGIVNIGSKTIDNTNYTTLYHELGHYLDYNNKSRLFRKRYIYDPLRPYILQNPKELQRGFDNFERDYKNVTKQFDDYYLKGQQGINEINQEVYNEMIKRYGTGWEHNPSYIIEYNNRKKDIYNKKKDNYFRQNGYAAVSDIMASIGNYMYVTDSNGNYVLDANGNKIVDGYTHDKDYFDANQNYIENFEDWGSSSYSGPRNEIIANLNDLYVSGNFDILYNYYPRDLVDKWRAGIIKINGTKGR